VIIGLKPALAQRDLVRALRAEASGRDDEAIGLYREAIRLDGWYRETIRLYVRIGGVEASRGNTSVPEYKAYQAENLVAEQQGGLDTSQLPAAIALLDPIAVSHLEMSHAAARREASLLTLYGANLFNDGAFGAAVEAWQTALTRDPDLLLPKVYLTRGYVLTGRYRDAEELARLTIPKVIDPTVRADLYDNLADAELATGALQPAHDDYFGSYYYNYAQNRRALAGLVGP